MDIDRDLPHLPEAEMKAKLALVLKFCEENFLELSQQTISLEEKIAAFDLLVELTLTDLKKWSENAATNYDPTKQKYHELDLQGVKTVWQLKLDEKNGRKLEKEEQAIISKFKITTALNTQLPFGKAASFMHCIVGGSPGNLLKSLNATSGVPGKLGTFIDIRTELLTLDTNQRTDLLKKLEKLKPITVHGEIWYVPADYLKYKKCYFDSTTGKVMGPCDIPLENDPEVLSEAMYLALIEELNKPENLPQLQDLAETQREKALEIYSQLKSKFFLKSTSFEQLILNDVIDRNQKLPPYLHQLREKIGISLNPLLELMIYLVDVIKKDKKEILESITLALEEADQHKNLPRSRRFSFGINDTMPLAA